jgi:hypothetical protein
MLGRKEKCLGVHHCANSRVRKAVSSDRNEHATFRFGPSPRHSACRCGPHTDCVRVVPENRDFKGRPGSRQADKPYAKRLSRRAKTLSCILRGAANSLVVIDLSLHHAYHYATT